ncbi:MAG: hypothetical protein WA864_28840 [Acetobacteraceae bacterium]
MAKTIDKIPRALNIPKVTGSQLSLLLNFGKPCLEINASSWPCKAPPPFACSA